MLKKHGLGQVWVSGILDGAQGSRLWERKGIREGTK